MSAETVTGTDVVTFHEIDTADELRFGVATLNAPSTLNALSLDMIRLLGPQLHAWAADERVVGVVLQATGEKAFCAGGDLQDLYASMKKYGSDTNPYALTFFAEEYALDHLIHTYPKPFLCWGHGIVMGGGMGLMTGASHRVVTPATRMAMPEITVGLFPDVGGTWFLPRMPGRTGRFLALTGVPLNCADALYCGLADHLLPNEARTAVFDAIAAASWHGDAKKDRAQLTHLLQAHAIVEIPASNVQQHQSALDELMAGDDLLAIAARLREVDDSDPWLQKAAAAFKHGSPTSAALAFELQGRATGLSLAEIFRMEFDVAAGCAAHADFAEGIRALIIDKDRQPKWSPATLEEVTPEHIADHFKPRYQGAHPLAAL